MTTLMMKLSGLFIGRALTRGLGVALLAGLATTGCGRLGGDGTASATAELAAATGSVGMASDMSSAPELAGLMEGLMPPRLPDGVEGFRCDSTPTIQTTTVCDRTFPSSIALDWTGCAARPHDGSGSGPGPGGPDGGPARGDGDDDGATSAGTVTITNSVSIDPAGSCDPGATYTFDRSAKADVTTTETDGDAAEVVASISTTSTRQPSTKTFTQLKTYAITRTDRDAQGATTRTTQISGQVTESFDGSGATPVRTIDGTLEHDRDGGTSVSLTVTGVVLPVAGDCRWPTAGTIVATKADGTTRTLVFGPTCGQATLDGAAVTLPAHGIHLDRRNHGRDRANDF
jgi:hypothetical protein